MIAYERSVLTYKMVLKKIQNAAEETVFIEDNVEGDILCNELKKEIRKFTRRNSLAVVAYRINGREPVHCCCSRCLKAKLLKKCEEMRMNDERKRIEKMFECETGHDGYFIDKSRMYRI